jgi:murein L,D-transpeptidase YcbB/YkuD
VGGGTSQGLPDAEPGQPAGDEGRHQALHRDRGCRRLADPARRRQLQAGALHPTVSLLRQRLLLSGDLREGGNSQNFDLYVDKAVKRYQASNGLAPTGVVDKRTIQALNVPAAARLKQLKSTSSA